MPQDYSNYFALERTCSLEQIKPGSKIHLIGIAGVAMGQLAAELSKNYRVSGSDKAFYEPMGSFLKKQNIKLYDSFSAENIASDIDLVVIGNVATSTNVEVLATEKHQLAYTCFPKLLAETLIADRKSIVVTGTHGKTTTSALIAQTLRNLSSDPACFIGGVVPGIPSLHIGESPISVVEGDEYDSAFFAKRPKFSFYPADVLIINAIEFDHGDIYNSLDDILREFDGLVASLKPDAYVIANVDCPNIAARLPNWCTQSKATFVSFSTDSQADYQIKDTYYEAEQYFFSANDLKFNIQLAGKFNARNSLAASIAINHLGFSWEEIIPALSRVKAPKRRQEIFHKTANTIFIEDFAHHPTAVKEILIALKEKYPDRTLIAALEPASNTARSGRFDKEFQDALQIANHSIIKAPEQTATEIAKEIKLLTERQEEFVVLLMSNSSFGGLKELI